ncbi:glycogen phosphorylase [Phycisphaerales bacterium]|nr:glycogen phosphorylase [Phycisphaerales bacterium]
MPDKPRVAYFSMEIALDPAIPTYSGGLGILAGDTLRAAADLALPVVGVTLLHRTGYFFQKIDEEGRQTESPVRWVPEGHLERTAAQASVSIEGREVHLSAWRYTVKGPAGGAVPVYLIDAHSDLNDAGDRHLTDSLYGGDQRYRLAQEIVLGIGGVRILRSLGFTDLDRYHMNEGHAALLTAELLRERALELGAGIDSEVAARLVREQCTFTTHTPLAAGHDRFPIDLVRAVAGERQVIARSPFFIKDGLLDTTHTALALSRYANAVSRRHAEVSRRLFPGSTIDSITNGVHPATWVCQPMAALLDRAAPGWRTDGAALSEVSQTPDPVLWGAHVSAKRALIRRIDRDANAGLVEDAFTIGVARRCTPYKRLDLILSDASRLRAIAAEYGPVQVVFAGKAHPRDGGGKEMIERLNAASRASSPPVRIAFIPGYDMELAAAMVAGCDLWINVPQRPLEASGTSGMKAAMNAVPSLSVLDGWWIEGCEEGVTGWAVGEDHPPIDYHEEWRQDAEALYDKLGRVILPMFYKDRPAWIKVMRGAISRNGPRFCTQRMMREYAAKAYDLPGPASLPGNVGG